MQAPVLFSHFSFLLFPLCFPSLFSSSPLSVSLVALLAPSTSLKAADVGLCVQMFCVYHSPVTSLTNSHTVNIYRGVSSPLLPHCTETVRETLTWCREWKRAKEIKAGREKQSTKERDPMPPTRSHACCWPRQLLLFSSVCKKKTQCTDAHTDAHTQIDSGMHALHSFCTGLSPTSSLLTVLT